MICWLTSPVHGPRSTVHGLLASAETRHGLAVEADNDALAGLHDRPPDQPGLFQHQLDQLIVGEFTRLEPFLPRGRALPREQIGQRSGARQLPQLIRRKRLLEDIPGRDGNIRLRESLPRLPAARSIGTPVQGDRIGHADLPEVRLGSERG